MTISFITVRGSQVEFDEVTARIVSSAGERLVCKFFSCRDVLTVCLI